jgi:hypothetical protein
MSDCDQPVLRPAEFERTLNLIYMDAWTSS